MRVWIAIGTFLGLAMLLAGCLSSPAPSADASGRQGPPQWVMSTPEEDGDWKYFTGSGSSPDGDLAKAEEAARGQLIDEIMRFMGVRITSETTATAKASLDSYQSDVVQALTSRSSGRVSGLEISERWTDSRQGGVTLYLLARYNKGELLKEKKRLEDLFKEQQEAISGPEREARNLEASGQHYQAALKYIEAAAASYKSDLENARIRFERNINGAREALRRISLVKLNDNLSSYVGEEFTEPLALKVVAGAGANSPGIAGVSVKFSYPEVRANGRKSIRAQQVSCDGDGVARFMLPAAEFVGLENVTATLDLTDALETLQAAPRELLDLVDSLEEVALMKKASFTFESVSRAKKIPTGVALFDLDASGNPLSLTESSSGLLESLNKAGFQVQALGVDVQAVSGRSDAQIIAQLKRAFGGQVVRAIYGTARIADHQQDGGFIIINVTGTIKVVDLQEEKVLLTVNRSKRAQGSNTSTALSAAFKNLGGDLGDYIRNNLR